MSFPAQPDPHVIVLFGATGDLARRKLLPGLLRLSEAGLMPEQFRLVGTSLDEMDDEDFRAFAHDACMEFARAAVLDNGWRTFAPRLTYVPQSAGGGALADAVHAAVDELGGADAGVRILHYLSVPPSVASSAIGLLADSGLAENSRVVMEKPFGTDLDSARKLNATVHEVFEEHQVFRIDHFLGKEAAQNVLALRFANGLFEPIWNRQHIHHVLIEVPETLGIGMRANFYEATGAYRDMVVTHLMQVLAFVAMEPPTSLEPHAITEEKNKVFRSLKPLDPDHVVRGQYRGYRDEPGVAADSETETFVALRCEVDNWRWSGVPFYLRTGKRMAESARIISISYHEPPHGMFPAESGVRRYGPDHLTFDLDERSRMSLSFYGKRPGPGMQLDKASMQFSLEGTGKELEALEAYERLIHDAMVGDHTLFTTADGIERLWEVSAPLLASPPPLQPYEPGTWGPDAIDDLIAPYRWRLPFERRWRRSI
ncbi:MAG: glucose-6-phosphate 1-dehydrogenase [Conexibacter sp.]|jgi:glucose-6-phosphate 1-dehydrogenase|nr:glucose-6-phosphate 1-dehydrogenase [Conexibacter sp.]